MAQAALPFAPGGFDILPGRSGSGALASLPAAQLEALIAELGTQAQDAILLDTGAGLDSAARRLAAWADTLLVIATDEPTSLTDAYAVLKLHSADCAAAAPDARVVINQAASQAAGQRSYATLARACGHFLGRSPPLAGIVRRDDHVREAIRRQTPLLTRHPSCPAAEDVRAIARALQ
jgi:flagellar biosynthesis protein FlhG